MDNLRDTVNAHARDRVRALRAQRDMSLRAVASKVEELGVPTTAGTLSDIENGRRDLRAAEVVALASVLGTSVGDLLGLDDLDASAVRAELAGLKASLREASSRLFTTARETRSDIGRVATEITNIANSLPAEMPQHGSLGNAIDDEITLQFERRHEKGSPDEQGSL